MHPDVRDRWAPFQVAGTLALLLLTTGPLYRVRTWWRYDDPLATDPVVVALFAMTGAAAVMWLLARRAVPRSATVVVAAFVVGWLLVGTAWSSAWDTTLREALQIAGALAVGLAARLALGIRRFALALWMALHIGLTWSFIAIVVGQPGTQDDRGNWAGVFFNRNSLALVAALGLIVGVGVLADARVRRRPLRIRDVVVTGFVAIDARLLLGSAARTPWIALGVAAVAVGSTMVACRFGAVRARAGRLAAGSAVGLLVAGAVAWAMRHTWVDAIGRSTDLTGRVAVWDVAVEWWRDRPVLGHGYLAAWDDPTFVARVEFASGHVLTSAHSTFVELLMGAGLIGLFLWLAFVGCLWVDVIVCALVRPTVAAFASIAVLVFVVVENVTETLFVGGHITVALLGALLAVRQRAVRRCSSS